MKYLWPILFACLSSEIFALTIPVAGIETLAGGGASQTISRGFSSLFHNPANLHLSRGIQVGIESVILSVDVSYANPKLDSKTNQPIFPTVQVKKVAPPVVVGSSFRLPKIPLTIGIAFQPLGTGGEQVTEGVPNQLLGKDFTAVNATTTSSAFNLVLGAAYSVGKPLTLGIAYTLISDKNAIAVTAADSDADLLKASWSGTFHQFRFGYRGVFLKGGALILGGSYITSVVKKYTGERSLQGAASESTSVVGYSPQEFSLGVEVKTFPMSVFIDYQMVFASKGKDLLKSGLQDDEPVSNLKDVSNFAGGVKFKLNKKTMIMGGVGLFQPIIGDGKFDSDGTKILSGPQFGNLSLTPWVIMSGGLSYTASSSLKIWGIAGFLGGRREIGIDIPAEGTYILKVYYMGTKVSYKI